MEISFDWKKSLIALGIAAFLIIAAARWTSSPSLHQRPEMVSGGQPNAFFGPQTFQDSISSLPENKRACLKKAYGPLYEKILNPEPGFLIPANEEWRVEEANKCLKTL